MSRAEEMATNAGYCGDIHNRAEYTSNDVRSAYIEGFEQAEKDLAMTKNDIECIFNLVRKNQLKYSATEGCFQEVADIFNEQRNK